jgi:hypothetical protein
MTLLMLGERSRAQLCEEALRTACELQAELLEALTLQALGTVMMETGDHQQAEEYLRAGLRLRHRFGNPAKVAQILTLLALVARRRHDWRRAALLGAASAHQTAASDVSPVCSDLPREQELVRRSLSPTEFQAAWTTGAAMNVALATAARPDKAGSDAPSRGVLLPPV